MARTKPDFSSLSTARKDVRRPLDFTSEAENGGHKNLTDRVEEDERFQKIANVLTSRSSMLEFAPVTFESDPTATDTQESDDERDIWESGGHSDEEDLIDDLEPQYGNEFYGFLAPAPEESPAGDSENGRMRIPFMEEEMTSTGLEADEEAGTWEPETSPSRAGLFNALGYFWSSVKQVGRLQTIDEEYEHQASNEQNDKEDLEDEGTKKTSSDEFENADEIYEADTEEEAFEKETEEETTAQAGSPGGLLDISEAIIVETIADTDHEDLTTESLNALEATVNRAIANADREELQPLLWDTHVDNDPWYLQPPVLLPYQHHDPATSFHRSESSLSTLLESVMGNEVEDAGDRIVESLPIPDLSITTPTIASQASTKVASKVEHPILNTELLDEGGKIIESMPVAPRFFLTSPSPHVYLEDLPYLIPPSIEDDLRCDEAPPVSRNRRDGLRHTETWFSHAPYRRRRRHSIDPASLENNYPQSISYDNLPPQLPGSPTSTEKSKEICNRMIKNFKFGSTKSLKKRLSRSRDKRGASNGARIFGRTISNPTSPMIIGNSMSRIGA